MNLLKTEYAKEVQILKLEIPDVSKIPAVRFDVAKELVSQKYNRKIRNPFDLEPEEEALIGQYFKEEYGSDFVFERQIRMYLSESGIPGAAVSVTLEPGNTGEAKEIRIEAPMRQTSIYREEQKKQREMLDEKLTEIKSVLSEVYGTDPAHIMVEISE